MSLFSFLTPKKSERVLLISIGSGTVVGAFVEIGPAISTVIATVTTEIAVLTDLSLEKFENEMQKALKGTLGALSKFRIQSPDRVMVYFSSPWYASQVRTAKMSRPTPFVVTKKLIDDMIAKELKAFEDEEIAAAKGTPEALRPIESKVLQVKLNGYPTAEPLNLSATELEFSIFISIAPERMLAGIEDIMKQQYHHPVTFSSFLAASFIVTRDFFPQQEDYLLIDIGGEVTDITLVREGSMIQSASFPHGRNFMLRMLSAGLKRSIAESVALCTLYIENKVDDAMKEACATILSEAKDTWLNAFQKVLFTVSNELSIPDTVLLSVGPDVSPWFIETIRSEKFNQYALTEKEFKVIVLSAEVFHDSLAFADGVPRNSCILIEALACTRLVLGKNQPVSKDKLVKVS